MRVPSVKTLTNGLNIDEEKAKRIRRNLLTASGLPMTYEQMLRETDIVLGTHGVEYISSSNGTGGIYYCNTGETYDNTVIIDTNTNTARVCSWGYMVETYPSRFRD